LSDSVDDLEFVERQAETTIENQSKRGKDHQRKSEEQRKTARSATKDLVIPTNSKPIGSGLQDSGTKAELPKKFAGEQKAEVSADLRRRTVAGLRVHDPPNALPVAVFAVNAGTCADGTCTVSPFPTTVRDAGLTPFV
jgi:hypothetical protein